MPALACAATAATGAIATTSCDYAGTAGGGYTYYYSDGTSTACVNSANLCTTGSVGASSSTIWGAGFGFSVAASGGGNPTLAAGGLMFATGGSAPPTTLQVGIVAASGPCSSAATGGNGCCYRPSAAAGSTIAWGDFIPNCYNGASDAGAFSPSDGLTKIEFQVVAGTAAQTYNYCVTALSF